MSHYFGLISGRNCKEDQLSQSRKPGWNTSLWLGRRLQDVLVVKLASVAAATSCTPPSRLVPYGEKGLRQKTNASNLDQSRKADGKCADSLQGGAVDTGRQRSSEMQKREKKNSQKGTKATISADRARILIFSSSASWEKGKQMNCD